MALVTRNIGRFTLDALGSTGRGALLLKNIAAQLPSSWRLRREILEQMHVVAVGSLPLIVTTSIFIGAVTAVQAVYQMQAYVNRNDSGVF